MLKGLYKAQNYIVRCSLDNLVISLIEFGSNRMPVEKR